MHRLLFIVVSAFTFSSCLNDVMEAQCEDTYYSSTIEPLLLTRCSGENDCHVEGGNANSDFDKYADVYANREDIIRRIELPVSDPDFMPKDEAPLPPEEIRILKEWVAAGAPGCDP